MHACRQASQAGRRVRHPILARTERDGGDDDRYISPHPRLLDAAALPFLRGQRAWRHFPPGYETEGGERAKMAGENKQRV